MYKVAENSNYFNSFINTYLRWDLHIDVHYIICIPNSSVICIPAYLKINFVVIVVV
jgi:hypothetical protein